MDSFKAITSRSYNFNPVEYAQDWKWQLLAELYEKNFANDVDKSKRVLPKKIHQIWLGSPIPEKYKVWGESWKRFHPDWEYRLWTDDDVYGLNLPNLELYNSLSNYGAKSDILRYHILNQFGGIYVDTDFECLKSFDCLQYLDFFTGVGYPGKVELYVGIIGCIPHHPIMEQVVKEVNLISRDLVASEILGATSSHFFTRTFFKIITVYQEGIVVLPTDYLYPFSNNKGHHLRKGKDYVKPCSLAIHYWEVSWGIDRGRTDWIQGEKFQALADFVYTPKERHRDDYNKSVNTFNPSALGNVNIVYTHTMYVKQLFEMLQFLRGKFIIITHNSDINIDKTFKIPENVIKWYAQNVNTKNDKLQSIPIGLENNIWDKRADKKKLINEQLKQKRAYRRLVYMNHNISTNVSERAFLYPLFEKKAWITAVRGKNGVNPAAYIENIYNHKFVICPEGNGMDTHRTWEALYLGAIPIEKRNINNQYYTDLPICFVDQWEELTEDFLNKEWVRIKGIQWNLSKLNFEYWRVKIKKGL